MTDATTHTSPAEPSRSLRLGVIRAANASADATVATMEARVVRAELERRLGELTLDLRTDGVSIGPWLPRAHAAWPADVDATVDLSTLGDRAGQLVSLFGRTIEPVAVEVRGRMLHHLGVLPVGDGALTDGLLADLLPPPARPTDLWLVVRAAEQLATTEPAHHLLRPGSEADAVHAELDRWFDRTVASLPAEATAPSTARLRAELDDLRSCLAAATDEMLRRDREAVERIDDLETERDSLRERLDRAQLDGAQLDRAQLDRVQLDRTGVGGSPS